MPGRFSPGKRVARTLRVRGARKWPAHGVCAALRTRSVRATAALRTRSVRATLAPRTRSVRATLWEGSAMTFDQQLDVYLRARCTLLVVVTPEEERLLQTIK